MLNATNCRDNRTNYELITGNERKTRMPKRMPKMYWEKPKAHTKAKLELLGHYLGAWFGILANAPNANGTHRFDEIAYLDGFCGRGEYEDGQEGSPLIAVRFANSVAAKRGDLTIHVILLDKSNDSCG